METRPIEWMPPRSTRAVQKARIRPEIQGVMPKVSCMLSDSEMNDMPTAGGVLSQQAPQMPGLGGLGGGLSDPRIMGILSAAGESIGTHHVKLFRDNGGTCAEMEIVTALVALAMGTSRSFEFMHGHWQQHFPPMDAVATYRNAVSRMVGDSGVPLNLAKYMMLGVHTTFGHRWGVEQTLLALYETGADEGKMAESISLPFLAAGINRLIDASEIWLELIRSGRVKPSEPFHIWAETSKIGALKI